jgi:hypothetical protein
MTWATSERDDDRADSRIFHRARFRVVIPMLFAAYMFGSVIYHRPEQWGFALVGFACLATMCILLHGGIVISSDGIGWYVVTPRWRYRFVPWEAVNDMAQSRWSLHHHINLDVQPGRYEPWVWGTPRAERPMIIKLHISALVDSHAVWETLQEFYAWYQVEKRTPTPS